MFNAKDQFLILNALMMERKIKEVKGEIDEADAVMIGGKAYTHKRNGIIRWHVLMKRRNICRKKWIRRRKKL